MSPKDKIPPDHIYLDPATGEIVEEETDDVVQIPRVDLETTEHPDEALLEAIGRKLYALEAVVARLKTQLAWEEFRLAGFRERVTKACQAALARIKERTKKKTYEASTATFKFRNSSHLEVRDEAAAIEHAMDEGELDAIKTTTTLLPSKLPKDLVDEGKWPGVVRVEEPDKFSIKINLREEKKG